MNNNQLQLVTYEQAKKLKAAGFDWPCWEGYNEAHGWDIKDDFGRCDFNAQPCSISAPTVALALKWMRDVEGIMNAIAVNRHYCGRHKTADGAIRFMDNADTYDQAESALLDELLTLLENEKDN